MKLNKSDKIILLVFLVVLILGLGGWLIVYPAIQSISDNQNDLEKAKTERDIVYANLSRESTIDQEIKDAIKQGEELQKYFYDDLTPYQADMILSDILDATKMDTKGLSIGEFTTEELSLEDFVEVAVSYPLKDYADLYGTTVVSEDGSDKQEAPGSAMTYEDFKNTLQNDPAAAVSKLKDRYVSYLSLFKQTVGAITIEFTVEGTRGDYLKFLDYVKDMEKATYINSCTIGYTGKSADEDEAENNPVVDENGQEEEITFKDNTKIKAQISLTFFSVKPMSSATTA